MDGGDVMQYRGEEALHVHVGWKTGNGFWRFGGWEILCVRFRWDLCEDEMGGFLKGSRRVCLYINITFHFVKFTKRTRLLWCDVVTWCFYE